GITISRHIVRGLLMVAAKYSDREQICGLLFETDEANLYVVATDGKILIALRHDRPDNVAPGQRFVAPRSLFRQPERFDDYTVSWDRETGKVSVDTMIDFGGRVTLTADVPAKRFPNWREVIPARVVPGETVLDPRLMRRLQKAAVAMDACGEYGIRFATQTGKAALVSFGGRPDVIGCVMPVRVEALPPALTEAPAWAVEPVAAEA
ncbi:MAG: hypothetical protein AB7F67_21625, partial [Rhodospirillaceae bacterium]